MKAKKAPKASKKASKGKPKAKALLARASKRRVVKAKAASAKTKAKAAKATKAKAKVKASKVSKASKPAASRAKAAKRAASKLKASRIKVSRVKASKAKAAKPPEPNRAVRRPPGLDRERRTIREAETIPTPPSSLNMDRRASAARSGRHELAERLRKHTSTGPALTAGDVDADWEDAETVGDEAPGGDNPTPDQDVVEEIGQALGITYEDNEELKGGDELSERDRHRWELDPASKDDFDEED